MRIQIQNGLDPRVFIYIEIIKENGFKCLGEWPALTR